MWSWILAATFVLLASKLTTAFAPNYFLGTCLDDAWVASMEASLNVSRSTRNSLGRLSRPFMQTALKYTRFTVDDPRTRDPNVYADSCIPSGAAIFGVGAQVDANDNVIDKGSVDGSLVLELNGWTSHTINSLLFAILATEVYGYKVSFYRTESVDQTTERMSTLRAGKCTPTHLNFEVWALPARERKLAVFANVSYIAGATGYLGYSGLYTTTDFVARGMNSSLTSKPFDADFWKDYRAHDTLIDALAFRKFVSNSGYYPIQNPGCTDGSFGCKDGCAKSFACTQREAQGSECLVVTMMLDTNDPGHIQAAMSNLGIPAYFCFLGYNGAEQYALDMQQRGQPVLFYHHQPNEFMLRHPGVFQRVVLPYPTPERVAMATGTFGEYGYGQPTDNPINVDIPPTRITKYAARILQDMDPLQLFVSKYMLSDLQINELLLLYTVAASDTSEPDPKFRAACNWLKANYDVWRQWLDRLPLCSLDTHVQYNISGCDNTSAVRTITFAWNTPHPANASAPFMCDGGLTALPRTITTSRTCDWLFDDDRRWIPWSNQLPVCDASFYNYSISPCNARAKRVVQFSWLIANAGNASRSAECRKGVPLPDDILIECGYMPTTTSAFTGLLIATGIVALLLIIAMVFVFVHRAAPVIKRSQYELLEVMLFGGLLICIAVVAYAGKPTRTLCALRPVSISTGFTTIFSSLFVKSLRVYRVFAKRAMKRVKVSLLMMLKVLLVFFVVDAILFTTWFVSDFPEPQRVARTDTAAFQDGDIYEFHCASSSTMFSTLLMFWKAILLCMGMYMSFLIRNVSSDFQESMWIFASAIVVLVGCLVVLPLTYLVEMPAPAFYIMLATVLLFCTVLVMVFMLAPKALRLHSVIVKRGSVSSATGSSVGAADKYASSVIRRGSAGTGTGGSSDADSSSTSTAVPSVIKKKIVTPVANSVVIEE